MDKPPPPPVSPPPGWYADGSGQGGQRWWDGNAWAPLPLGTLPPPPAGTAASSHRGRRVAWSGGALALVGALVGAVVAVQGPSGPPPWPKSIAPIAAFVSKDRGLKFLHTVPVHFVAPTTFDKQIAEQDQETASEKAQDQLTAAEYRALGLIGGRVNLDSSQSDLDQGDILAYYDDQKKDIVVRGTALDPATRITLAHEMTHTLQDQHFNLTRLDNNADTADKEFAVTAIEEGDAVVTENDYAASLSARQQQEADAEQNAQGSSSTGGGSGPAYDASYLDVSSAVPYVLGPDFILTLYAANGPGAVNAAFEHPPATELDIVDPAVYLTNSPTKKVAVPALPPQTTPQGQSDSFGAFDTYMTLAGYMDARVALIAADGWDGGAYVQYRQAGRTCTKVSIGARTAGTTQILLSAFETWAKGLSGHQATVALSGQLVEVTACDPGTIATAGPRSREHALDIVDDRNSNMSQAYLYDQLSPQVALCVGDQSLTDTALLTAEATANQNYSAPAKAVQSTIDTQTMHLIALCQGPNPPASP